MFTNKEALKKISDEALANRINAYRIVMLATLFVGPVVIIAVAYITNNYFILLALIMEIPTAFIFMMLLRDHKDEMMMRHPGYK